MPRKAAQRVPHPMPLHGKGGRPPVAEQATAFCAGAQEGLAAGTREGALGCVLLRKHSKFDSAEAEFTWR